MWKWIWASLMMVSASALAFNGSFEPGKEYDFYFSQALQSKRNAQVAPLCLFRGAEYSVAVPRDVPPPSNVTDLVKLGTGTVEDVLCLRPDGSQVDLLKQ